MKILYISPENTVGTLSLWKRAHEELGNHCRYITYYPSLVVNLGYNDKIVKGKGCLCLTKIKPSVS